MSHKFVYNNSEKTSESSESSSDSLSIDGDIIDGIIDKDLLEEKEEISEATALNRLVEFVKKHVRSNRTAQDVRRERVLNKYSHGLEKVEAKEKKGVQLKKIA